MIECEVVLLDMGGVLLEMAGGRGAPRANLDWRGRRAMMEVVRARRGRIDLDTLERLVFSPWRSEYERRVRLGREAAWEPHLQRLRNTIAREIPDDLLEAWFRPYGESLRPVAGARRGLERLRAMGLRLAVVSNVPLPGRYYKAVLGQWGLDEGIEAFYFSYDEASRKPSPVMLRRALAALEVDADRALMVGDLRDRDVAAGRAAGTRTAWIRTEDGGGPSPDLEVASLEELPDRIAPIA